MVLRDELAAVGDDGDARARRPRERLAGERGDDEGLAGPGRQHDQPVAEAPDLAPCPVPRGLERVEARALVIPKLQHGRPCTPEIRGFQRDKSLWRGCRGSASTFPGLRPGPAKGMIPFEPGIRGGGAGRCP